VPPNPKPLLRAQEVETAPLCIEGRQDFGLSHRVFLDPIQALIPGGPRILPKPKPNEIRDMPVMPTLLVEHEMIPCDPYCP
jgi:hypothetical protein